MKTLKTLLDSSKSVIAFVSFDSLSEASKAVVASVISESTRLNCGHKVYLQSKNLNEDRLLYWGRKLFTNVVIEATQAQSVFEVIKENRYDPSHVLVVDRAEKTVAYQRVQQLLESKSQFQVHSVITEDKRPIHMKAIRELFTDLFTDYEARQFLDEINGVQRGSFDGLRKMISEKRESYFLGETFKIGESVSDSNGVYEILDRGSNYVTVVNESGSLTRKFIEGLNTSKEQVQFKSDSFFKGMSVSEQFRQNAGILESFTQTVQKYQSGAITDAVAILKAIGLVETLLEGKGDLSVVERLTTTIERIGESETHSCYLKNYTTMLNEDKTAKLQAARIIAGAIDAPTNGTDPVAIVNAAIKLAKTKSNPAQIKILKDMLKLAGNVGLTYDKSLLESVDHSMRAIHKDHQLLKEKPTAEVLTAHKDMRKIGPDYEARDVGGKRAMIKDILGHTHGPRTLVSYKGMKKHMRDALSEEQEINELSPQTLKSYSDKAKTASVAHKKDPFKTAFNRFKGQERVTDRVHKAEMDKIKNKKVNEGDEMLQAFGYDQLKKQLAQTTGDVESVEASPAKKYGHSMNPSTDTHRKQIVRKLKGHD